MATPLVTHHLDEVGSTQREARLLAAAEGRVPLLLIADRQTSGRGRTGHGWMTAPRALACSLVAGPRWQARDWGRIPLLAGVAAIDAVHRHAGARPSLKWPNDLISSAGKVGGILVEAADDLVVIGLGINLWWPDAPAGIAAIDDEDPGEALAAAIAADWASGVLAGLERAADRWGHDDYRAACETIGKAVTWEPDGEGIAIDVAPDGGLVVEKDEETITLRSGAVHTVRTATLAPGDAEAAEGIPG